MIGVAYVDLSQMVFIENVYKVSGYFHIVKREIYNEIGTLSMVNPSRLSIESLGQLKVTVTTSTNLKKTLGQVPQAQSLRSSYSPLKYRTETQ